MADYFTSSAQLDEHMAEVVKKYALLYDKQKNGYRDEAVKAQTWQKVANECDVGTGKLNFSDVYFLIYLCMYVTKYALKSIENLVYIYMYALVQIPRNEVRIFGK